MEATTTARKSSPQSWDDNDDQLLVQLKEVNNLGWKQIAKHFKNRTSNACQFRWRRLKSGQLKKHSKFGGSKTSKSISSFSSFPPTPTSPLSMNSSLSSSVNKSPDTWTLEEDNLIRKRISKNLSVTELSILLPHKSITEIEKRVSLLERQKLSIGSLLSNNTYPSSNSSSDSESDFDGSFQNQRTVDSRASSFSSNASSDPLTTKQVFSLPPIITRTSSSMNSIILPPLQSSKGKSDFITTFGTTGYNANTNVQLPPLSKVYSMINQH